MPQYTLTILDTTGIQSYIFGSNRLQENVGASELVKRATEDWVYEALPIPNNINPGGKDNGQKIETGKLKAEVIYAGGGNALILFAGFADAKSFAAEISRKLIETAPGINFTIVHTEFDWDEEALGGDKSGVVFETFAKLADAKRSRPMSRPLAGLSVSAFCQSTGLPAIGFDKDGRLISAETKAKLGAFKTVSPRLNDIYEMEIDFNKLGENRQDGKGSYLAVVHADGNGMGQRVEAIAKAFPHAGAGNRAYIAEIRQFSRDMRRATEAAVAEMEMLLSQSPTFDEKTKKWHIVWQVAGKAITKVPIRDDKFLPYRRIIVGGDDVTFVCDGHLALTLTAAFLQLFEEKMKTQGNPHLADVHAAAGIAVVKTHYPFIRAYKLAEALTAGAKKWIKKTDEDFSVMDWHFAPGGLAGELDYIREREYRLDKDHTLLMRPIALDSNISWRNWQNFSRIVEAFNQPDDWGSKRNKVKAFREAMRKGKIGVEQFLVTYPKSKLPGVAGIGADVQKKGWASDEHCAYFDAIEAMEFYLPLRGDSHA